MEDYYYQIRRSHIVRVAGLVSIICASSQLCCSQPVPVSISWHLADQRITLREPVLLTLTMENHGGANAVLNLGTDFTGGLLVTVVTPEGTVVRTPPKEPHGLQALGIVTVKSGERYTHEFIVDEWYDFNRVGKYQVQAALRFPITIDDRPFVPKETALEQVVITEHDDVALKRRCDELVTKIIATTSVDVAGTAARALSAINDPIAIPYLIRALMSPFLYAQGIAVTGLSRFKTREAILALIPVATGSGPHSSEARAMLLESGKNLQDAELRRYLYRALRESEPN